MLDIKKCSFLVDRYGNVVAVIEKQPTIRGERYRFEREHMEARGLMIYVDYVRVSNDKRFLSQANALWVPFAAILDGVFCA